MSVKISKMQILDPSYWGKLTREAHLGWMGMQDPQWISKFIDRVYALTRAKLFRHVSGIDGVKCSQFVVTVVVFDQRFTDHSTVDFHVTSVE